MIPNPFRSMSYAQIERALRCSALVLLLAGLAASLFIWRAQDKIERENAARLAADPDAALPLLDSRKYLRDVELYNGKAGILLEQAEQLFHGKALAKTIAAISVITATGLFLVSVRWPD